MKERYASVVALVTLSVITILAVTWRVRYNWPDNVHVRHGIPLTWGTHILITIQGPVDIWRVNLMALALDLALWLSIIVVSQVILVHEEEG